jgi:DNA-binding HxlR family transcriptional regulator
MSSIVSGRRVRGSRSARPIMVLLDLMGRRMALRVLWELASSREPLTFRALRAAAETNPSVLNSRLKELRDAGIVEHGGAGYQLSSAGKALLGLLLPLNAWANDWAAELGERARPSARQR